MLSILLFKRLSQRNILFDYHHKMDMSKSTHLYQQYKK